MHRLAKSCQDVANLQNTTAIAHPVTIDAKINAGVRILALLNILKKHSKIEYLVRPSVKVYKISHMKSVK